MQAANGLTFTHRMKDVLSLTAELKQRMSIRTFGSTDDGVQECDVVKLHEDRGWRHAGTYPVYCGIDLRTASQPTHFLLQGQVQLSRTFEAS